jgi:hypothetical protein
MINVEYLTIMRKQAMEKAFIKVIRETRHKGVKENRV